MVTSAKGAVASRICLMLSGVRNTFERNDAYPPMARIMRHRNSSGTHHWLLPLASSRRTWVAENQAGRALWIASFADAANLRERRNDETILSSAISSPLSSRITRPREKDR